MALSFLWARRQVFFLFGGSKIHFAGGTPHRIHREIALTYRRATRNREDPFHYVGLYSNS